MKKANSFLLSIVAIVSGAVIALLMPQSGLINDGVSGPTSGADGIRLQPPPFFSVAQADVVQQGVPSPDFLSQEAGIAAYANIGKPIDLTKVDRFFRTREQETPDYIVGSVTPPGYEDLPDLREGADVHVYVHKDGWIIAYLLEWQHTAQIIDWLGYEQKQLTTNTLETTIRKFLIPLNVTDSEIGYYDFRYPDANSLMLVADAEKSQAGEDSFQVKIPVTIQVFDRTWSSGSDLGSKCTINETTVSELQASNWRIAQGSLRDIDFPQGQINTVTVARAFYGGTGVCYCGVAITYQEMQ